MKIIKNKKIKNLLKRYKTKIDNLLLYLNIDIKEKDN